MKQGQLFGTRVLVVEDEVLISMLLTDMLEQLDCETVGPAATIDEAWSLVEAARFDIAVLDIHVDGASIFEVADRVRARGIPLVIASGSGTDALPDRFRDANLLPKPYTLPALDAALKRALLLPTAG